ncbi:hypothetical protein PIB30_026963 [Stylosanthes scabra]|uniref:Uncharacterized protein n=1 Tax=Stylosanthes scabra TaxID=79078 RepID=A0ABU6QA72_9FABA|nr:hypothetical protein [Stylosanthes scabra]
MKKQCYDPISLDAFEDHSDWILEESPPFLTPEEIDALRNDLANMTLQPVSDDIGPLNLKDDQQDVEVNNDGNENVNRNEENNDQVPSFSNEETPEDFEITPWT